MSTSDGFSGRGTWSFVANTNVTVLRFTDVVRSEASHERILVRAIFVFDLRSATILVDRFSLTCVGD